MSDEADDIEFEPQAVATPTAHDSRAKAESEQLEGQPYDPTPNSFNLTFGKFVSLKWHAEGGAPLFCFLSIFILVVFALLVAVIAACSPMSSWPDEVFKFVGQAVLTLIGAVVGSSVRSASPPRVRRPPRT